MESRKLYGFVILFICASNSGVLAQDPEVYEEMKHHFEKMYEDWTNVTKYPRVDCSKDQLDFFKSCHDYKPSTADDDYYRLDDAAGPKFEPKSRRTDGGCERIDVLSATRAEWTAYRLAINGTYNRLVNGQSHYQIIASQHRYAVAPEAHNGPAFLCFHREYLARFEAALQMQDPSVCLMYIDWTTIYPLDNVCDSCIFSDDYYGTSNGVLSGFWSHWRGYSPGCTGQIYRQCDPNMKGYLFNEDSLNTYLQGYSSFPDWCAPTKPDFEYAHGAAHVCIGGTMNNLTCAVNDIIFWSHHACIDYYWQRARDSETNQYNKVNNYPTGGNIPQYQQATDLCYPFDDVGMRNVDGLSTKYDTTKSYRRSRLPCSSDAECNPTQDAMNGLWCYNGMCTSKLKIGAKCGSKPNNCCFRESWCTHIPLCYQETCIC